MSRAGVFVLLIAAAVQGLEQPRLVYPRLLEERSPDGKMVLHLHDELTLNLEAASIAAPRMRVLTQENGRHLTQFYDGNDFNRDLYQDVVKMATVSLKLTGKSVELEGIVDPNHRIQPLPAAERSEAGLIPHLIHEIERNEMKDKVLAFSEENQRYRFSARQDLRPAAVPPTEVTIEVFLVADKPHHTHFNKTRDLIIYFCVMFNSINLRFQEMTHPKVKLMLTGVEQNQDETFLHGDSKYTHDSETLRAFKSYAVEKKTNFGKPDVVFLVTGRDVVTDEDDGTISKNGLGIAYLGGLCTDGYVGLGEDNPGFFNGMFTVSHELGHLLGAQHDGSEKVTLVPGYMGSERCSWDKGYMMSYKDTGANHQRFSECSLEQMRVVISYRGRSCWVVLSAGQEQVDLYPGNMVTPEQVCKNVFPDKTGVYYEMINPKGNECKLKCKYDEADGRYMYTYSLNADAPDYTPCGQNKVCVRGLCVHDDREKGHRTDKPKPSTPIVTTRLTRSTTKIPWWKEWIYRKGKN